LTTVVAYADDTRARGKKDRVRMDAVRKEIE
jgi:hypothetical protein